EDHHRALVRGRERPEILAFGRPPAEGEEEWRAQHHPQREQRDGVDPVAIRELDDDALAREGDGAASDEERAREARLLFLSRQFLDAVARTREAVALRLHGARERVLGGEQERFYSMRVPGESRIAGRATHRYARMVERERVVDRARERDGGGLVRQ